MTTFLPYADFRQSARVLDRARLGKQRVETLQIVRSHLQKGGWANHPATLMWAGYTRALIEYGLVICDEWIRRGYRDSVQEQLSELVFTFDYDMPPWLGDERLHQSHRNVLLKKDPDWYSHFGWKPSVFTFYYWPKLSADGKTYTLTEGTIR